MADRQRILEKHLYKQMGQTCRAWELLAPGDRVMVAMSGGKDSYTLLHLLRKLVPRLPFEVELVAVHLDQVQPGYDGAPSSTPVDLAWNLGTEVLGEVRVTVTVRATVTVTMRVGSP